MPDFPRSILDYWHKAFDGCPLDTKGDFALTVVPTLNRKRPAMMLEGPDGLLRVALTPGLADAIGAEDAGALTIAALRGRLTEAGIVLHDPDLLFYLRDDATPTTDQSKALRQLIESDRSVFHAFQAEASEQDLEDAYVELDHWAVFGCFDGGGLASAASAYPWANSPIADLGVLTLPNARGKGHARAVVQAINQFSKGQGYEPQYRCQLDNHASLALAKSCGMTLFGTWAVAADAPQN